MSAEETFIRIQKTDQSRQFTRQEIHDIRDMAQAGYDWKAVQKYAKMPMRDVKQFVRITLPNCVAFFDQATLEKKKTVQFRPAPTE